MTYKAPPPESDDEQREYPEFSYPVRRRRQSSVRRRPSTAYSADEQPEIPKIRRASLRLDKQQIDDAALPTVDDEIDQEELREDTEVGERSSEKILSTPKRRSPAYRPSSPASRPRLADTEHHTHIIRPRTSTRNSRSYHPLLQRLPGLRHNQAVIVIGILALVILVIIPLFVSATRTITTVTSSSTTTDTGQPPGFQQAPLSAHEIIIQPQDTDHPTPPVYATSAYLLDADTGATLYAYNPFMHLPMLSTTKLMTASLAVEQGNLDQKITITDAMSRDISHLSADSAMFGIKKGQTYTLRDLLYGLLFVSGNDAAIAIADALAGNLQTFVNEMNQKAQQLSMYDTHFMNPHGLLRQGQYSSAHDLALLGRYSMSLPVLHKISGETVYHLPKGGNHPAGVVINENQFLWWYPGVDGGKTGFDGQSDFIQVMSCIRNHHHLIGVVMHTVDWWTDMRDLMNWGFDSFNWVSPHDADSPDHPIPYDNLWNFFARDKKENTIPTADQGRYYIYSGYSISGPIMNYFDTNGGLKKFGYPIKLPVASGGSSIGQQFEHGTISCDLTTNSCQRKT